MVATVSEALFDEFDGWLSDQPSLIDIRAIFDRMIDWTASRRGDAWLVALQLLVRAASDTPIAAVFQKRYAQFRRKAREAARKRTGTRSNPRRHCGGFTRRSGQRDGRRLAMMFPVEPERFGRGRIHALVNAAIVMLTPQAR